VINLAAFQQARGYYDEAEELYREGLQTLTDYYGPEHPSAASAMTMLSQTLSLQENYDEALEMTETALGIRQRVFGPDHPNVATTMTSLGQIALARDDLEAADSWYTQAEDIYVRSQGPEHMRVAVTMANRASVYLAAERYAEAAPVFERAIEIFQAAVSEDDPNIGIAQIKLGRALLRQSDFEGAASATLAGYTQLSLNANPLVSWLQAARGDLVEAYEALGRVGDAARFRTELEAAAASG